MVNTTNPIRTTADAVVGGKLTNAWSQNVVAVSTAAKNLDQFQSVKAALDAIGTTLPAASATQRYAILVEPGTYTEDNSAGPIALKSFISVRGLGHPESIRLVASTPGNDLFHAPLGVNDAAVEAMTLEGSTGAGKFCFVNESGLRRIYLNNVHFNAANGGCLTRGAGSFTHMTGCVADLLVSFPYEVQAGLNTEARCFVCDVRPGAAATVGFRANGGKITAQSCHVENATSAVKSEVGGDATLSGSHIENCVNALHIGAGGADNLLTAIGNLLEGSTFDVLSDANPGFLNTLQVAATTIDPGKVSVDSATFSQIDLLVPAGVVPDTIGPSEPGLYTSTFSPSDDEIYLIKIFNSLTLKGTGISFVPNSGGVSVRVGIYRHSDNTKVAESALTSVSGGGTALVTVNFTADVVLVPGTYWLAIVKTAGSLSLNFFNSAVDFGDSERIAVGPGGGALPASKTGTVFTVRKTLLILNTTT